MHGGMGNPSNRPKYGPGNTVVGEPLFLPDDAFPVPDGAPEMSPGAAPTLPPTDYTGYGTPAAPRAGSTGIAPTAAAEATTGEADGYGYTYQPNVSTPYPSAPVTLAPYPSNYGPQPPGVPVPPPQLTTRPRRAEGGPSLLAIGAISFVVIGGLTTGGFLVARSASTTDDGSDKPIATTLASDAPVAAVPVEDPNSVAGAIPTEAPRPSAHRPPHNVPTNRRGIVGPKKTAMPTVTSPVTVAPTAPVTPPADPTPAATQTAPTPDPTGSGRHRRGN